MLSRSKFLRGTPIRIPVPDHAEKVLAGYLDEEQRVFRWVLNQHDQRLSKWSALAKDRLLWDAIRPYVDTLEVLDMPDRMLYRIAASKFDENKWLLVTRGGEQWAVNKTLWEAHDEAR